MIPRIIWHHVLDWWWVKPISVICFSVDHLNKTCRFTINYAFTVNFVNVQICPSFYNILRGIRAEQIKVSKPWKTQSLYVVNLVCYINNYIKTISKPNHPPILLVEKTKGFIICKKTSISPYLNLLISYSLFLWGILRRICVRVCVDECNFVAIFF